MKHNEASAAIEATPEAIWEVLVDAPAWPSWDSGVVRVEGRVAEGAKVKVVSAVNPDRAFAVKVSDVEPGRGMTWSGGMPLGLFKGVRTYRLAPQPDGTTLFTMREAYSGPMLPLIWRWMPDLAPSFEQFAQGLKRRAEDGSTATPA